MPTTSTDASLYWSHMHPQLPLALDPQRMHSFASFWRGENTLLVDVLREFASGTTSDLQVFINGADGSGKTHLLSATCQAASDNGYRIAYLEAELISGADALDGYSQFDLVCLDDLQRLPQDHESELALFSLINTLRQHHGRLVISADRAVSELTIRLPDLKTRLSWGAVYRLLAVADEQLSQALAMRAQIVGLSLSDEVLN